MDDTWKHSKKESSSKSSGLLRSFSQKNSGSLPSSSSKFSIPRSHSLRNPSNNNNASSLLRSSSTRSSSSSKQCVDLPSQNEHGESSSSNITRKYRSMAKEHKARFYIMRRCVAMLVCWHKHGD